MRIDFTIPGPPCAQGRARISTRSGYPRAYEPEKSRNYKAYARYIIQEAATSQGWELTEGAVSVTINAYFPIPKSKSKKFRTAALDGLERPLVKPDLDNIVKIVKDAMTGIVYRDDKQAVDEYSHKYYAEVPRVEVVVRTLYDEERTPRIWEVESRKGTDKAAD